MGHQNTGWDWIMMDTIVNIAVYKFVPLDDLTNRRDTLLALCQRLLLKGTILLTPEGINFFLAGSRESIDEYLKELRSEPALADLEVKESYSHYQPFSRMLVKIKKEIIAFGVAGIDPLVKTSPRVSAVELKQWLDEGRPVTMLDVRNDMEFKVGTFENAIAIGVDDFRDFPVAVSELPERMKNEVIVTFCTGGVRCEKAGPQMESQGFNHVYQLDGGILKYFEDCGGAHYDGECFVFDKRVALNSELNETDTAQCYVCQAILTLEDCALPEYVAGVSCPTCFKSPEQRLVDTIAQRHKAIREVTTPLPGSAPYENVRPIYVTGKFDKHQAIEFLCALYTRLSREQWLEVFDRGQLLCDGKRVSPDDVVRAGQRLDHIIPETVEPAVSSDIKILHEDESVVVVHKPAPLPMHPCGRFNRNSLSWIMSEVYQCAHLRIVHRLDANTSGVVVFCKTGTSARKIQQQFERGQVTKKYIVRVTGEPTAEAFTSSTPISSEPSRAGARLPDPNGLAARTEFQMLEQLSDGTMILEARPVTGRTNQIRVHLWELGLPVVGDPLYLADGEIGHTQTLSVDDKPLCLHAKSISFKHPTTSEQVVYNAEIPAWAKS